MTDPIADMLTQIRNAQKAKLSQVLLSFSEIKFVLAQILEKEGFVASVEKETKEFPKKIKIILKYDSEKNPLIHEIKKISKPGQRIYLKKEKLPRVLSGLGVAIISTSQGLMIDKEARKRKLGGEIICQVW
jgi:small subunit ribosomal protein S8